jgi:toxin ParE1/3/4
VNLILSRLAELDLEEIWLYTFETWSIEQANAYQDILFAGMNEAGENPNFSKPIVLNNKTYLYYKIAHHYIFFFISESDILVSRILHESMDFEKHL